MTAMIQPTLFGDTLAEARDTLQEQARDGGAECPCCGQFAKVYRRQITAPMAHVLIEMNRRGGSHHFIDVPALAASMKTGRTRATGGDETKLRYWGLIEPQPGVRNDGSTRVGWWRVTPLGRAFARNQVAVPKYAYIYNGQLLELDDSEEISITDALGTRFNYSELMAGI